MRVRWRMGRRGLRRTMLDAAPEEWERVAEAVRKRTDRLIEAAEWGKTGDTVTLDDDSVIAMSLLSGDPEFAKSTWPLFAPAAKPRRVVVTGMLRITKEGPACSIAWEDGILSADTDRERLVIRVIKIEARQAGQGEPGDFVGVDIFLDVVDGLLVEYEAVAEY